MAEREEEEPTDLLTESRDEVEDLGQNMQQDGYELFTIRFILESEWKTLPDESLSELFDTCVGREHGNVKKVLQYIMVALMVSQVKNPSRLCRFVKENPFGIKKKDVLYKLLLVEIALELASNTMTCRSFIQYVVSTLRLPGRANYLPEDKNLRNGNVMVPYLLKLFMALDERDKIGPNRLEPLKELLKKRQLNKAALMVKNLVPLWFSYTFAGEKYVLTSQPDCPSPSHNLQSYKAQPDFVVAQSAGQATVFASTTCED